MSSDHPLTRLGAVLVVGIGGFAGSNARLFALESPLSDVQAVLLVNVLGSFLLGFLVYESNYTDAFDRTTRLLFTTGFLSSLTTYSTFALLSATAGRPTLLAGIVVANYGLGFIGVLLGRFLARRLGGESR